MPKISGKGVVPLKSPPKFLLIMWLTINPVSTLLSPSQEEIFKTGKTKTLVFGDRSTVPWSTTVYSALEMKDTLLLSLLLGMLYWVLKILWRGKKMELKSTGISKQCGFIQSCLLFQYFLRDRKTQEASSPCLCCSCPLDKMRLFISLNINILSG